MTPNEPPADLFTGDDHPHAIAPRQQTATNLLHRIQFHWQPQPLVQPSVDPALPELPMAERCAEVLRYSILRGEYWLSPKGSLREWLRLNLWLAAMLFIPALLLVPVVTYLLTGVSDWTALLATIVSNLAWIPASLFGGVLALSVLVLLGRCLLGRR